MACCLADIGPVARRRRAPPTRAAPCAGRSRGFEELGFTPNVGPELEFFLSSATPTRRAASAATSTA